MVPPRPASPAARSGRSPALALQALRGWTGRHWLIASLTAVLVGVGLGLVTVLIPNPVFGRDIPPVWWNYPVWLATALLSGLLAATYVRASGPAADDGAEVEDPTEGRTSRMGMAGGILAWFAVGCPVCNKIALLALGYSGAITWFAPVQPFLAVGGMVLLAVAVVWRLRGQVVCPVPVRSLQAAR